MSSLVASTANMNINDLEMDDYDSESEYVPSDPPSPSALSYDSSADTTFDDDAEDESDDDEENNDDMGASKYHCPPLTLSAMVVEANKDESGFPTLSNPLAENLMADALSRLAAPHADRAAILQGMIKTFTNDPDTIQMYLNAGLVDDNIARSIADKYAESLEEQRMKDLRANPDFDAYKEAVQNAFTRPINTAEEKKALLQTLAQYIDTYAYVVPRGSSYPLRAKALEGLAAIGEQTLNAPVPVRDLIIGSTAVGAKLGLAIKKLVNEAGFPEERKKHRGYIKRTGLAARFRVIMDAWNTVNIHSAGLNDLYN
ncbi:hypothetical protein BD324DRAFT_372473 [Kockovaella imperatae]|uniref:Uncharacterized protein n=1 Tax=Kockovaella imperatae TaxID=4999 RepID=A0A1Y1UKQ1_9TREE|nr:hypothetical protein BD324DRAFT_372473 [Kockovaella imperatae]ORX38631.1 hypothetical protein BD324DRAFT_372473 [Kockovaella imperatae]